MFAYGFCQKVRTTTAARSRVWHDVRAIVSCSCAAATTHGAIRRAAALILLPTKSMVKTALRSCMSRLGIHIAPNPRVAESLSPPKQGGLGRRQHNRSQQQDQKADHETRLQDADTGKGIRLSSTMYTVLIVAPKQGFLAIASPKGAL